MISDLFRLAVTNLLHRSLRSKLTIIGIFIGIAAVVSLISVGQGLQESINKQFESLGANTITVMAGGSGALLSGAPGSGAITAQITEDDLRVVESTRGVKSAAGILFKLGTLKFDDKVKYSYVMGMSQDRVSKQLMESQGFKIIEGRELRSGDRFSVVIGYNLAFGDFFPKKVKLRDKILIEGKEFRVVGIADKLGNPQDDSQLYITLDIFRETFNEPKKFAMIYADVLDGYTTDQVAENLKKELRRSRGVKEGEEDFTISTPQQLAEVFANVFGIVQVFIVGIAAISLLVGGIGIMNSMYTSVVERTKEIGVMKAVGARNEDVLMLFLFESGLLGLIGGAFGVLIGISLAKLVEIIAVSAGYGFLSVLITPELIIGALIFSFVVGAVSGLLPARRAAQLNPVDALRYE